MSTHNILIAWPTSMQATKKRRPLNIQIRKTHERDGIWSWPANEWKMRVQLRWIIKDRESFFSFSTFRSVLFSDVFAEKTDLGAIWRWPQGWRIRASGKSIHSKIIKQFPLKPSEALPVSHLHKTSPLSGEELSLMKTPAWHANRFSPDSSAVWVDESIRQ